MRNEANVYRRGLDSQGVSPQAIEHFAQSVVSVLQEQIDSQPERHLSLGGEAHRRHVLHLTTKLAFAESRWFADLGSPISAWPKWSTLRCQMRSESRARARTRKRRHVKAFSPAGNLCDEHVVTLPRRAMSQHDAGCPAHRHGGGYSAKRCCAVVWGNAGVSPCSSENQARL